MRRGCSLVSLNVSSASRRQHPVVEDDAAGVEHFGMYQLKGKVPGEVVEHPGSGGDDRRLHRDHALVDSPGVLAKGPKVAGPQDMMMFAPCSCLSWASWLVRSPRISTRPSAGSMVLENTTLVIR